MCSMRVLDFGVRETVTSVAKHEAACTRSVDDHVTDSSLSPLMPTARERKAAKEREMAIENWSAGTAAPLTSRVHTATSQATSAAASQAGYRTPTAPHGPGGGGAEANWDPTTYTEQAPSTAMS